MHCFWLLGGSNPRKGDVLVIAGATLYAVSNVSEVSELTSFNATGYFVKLQLRVNASK